MPETAQEKAQWKLKKERATSPFLQIVAAEPEGDVQEAVVQLVFNMLRSQVELSKSKEQSKNLKELVDALSSMEIEDSERLLAELPSSDIFAEYLNGDAASGANVINGKFTNNTEVELSDLSKSYDFADAQDQELVLWSAWYYVNNYGKKDFVTGDVSEIIEHLDPDRSVNVSRTLQLTADKRDGFIKEAGEFGEGKIRKRKIFKITPAGERRAQEIDKARLQKAS